MIKVGIVGHGKVGRIRSDILRSIRDVQLVFIADTDESAAIAGVPFFTNWHDALREPVDVVFACTTNRVLPDVVVEALSQQAHVFCEKPPGRTVEDVIRMREAEKQSGAILKFGFNHRYHDVIVNAKAMIESGAFGRVLWVRGAYGKAGGHNYDKSWRNNPDESGGGILLDQGIHMVDLFHFFLNTSSFDEVKSFITSSYWNVPVEDNAFAIMRTKSGQVAMLHSSATQWRHTFRLEIYLEKGYLDLRGILSSTRTYGKGGKEELRVAHCIYDSNGYPLPNPAETYNYYSDDYSWEREIIEFLDAVRGTGVIEQGNSLDALNTMITVRQIYEADSGRQLARMEDWNR